jgi:hypothetical protein
VERFGWSLNRVAVARSRSLYQYQAGKVLNGPEVNVKEDFHHRDAEHAEIGIFLNENFLLCAVQRLRGEISEWIVLNRLGLL